MKRAVALMAGCLDRLRQRPDLEQHPDFAVLRQAIEHADHLATTADEALRPPDDEPRLVELDQLVQRLDPRLRSVAGKRAYLQLRLSTSDGSVRVVAPVLDQVLIALVTRAAQSIDEFGEISVDTGWLDYVSSGNAADRYPRRHVRLTVSDTGHGIRREACARIAEPCPNLEPADALTGARAPSIIDVVRQMGGWLLVESELRTGTRVHICLPAIEA